MLVRSIEGWVDLFDEGNMEKLPILKMELVFDDNKMQFYPSFDDLEELVLFVVDEITRTLQSVSKLGMNFWFCQDHRKLLVHSHKITSNYQPIQVKTSCAEYLGYSFYHILYFLKILCIFTKSEVYLVVDKRLKS